MSNTLIGVYVVTMLQSELFTGYGANVTVSTLTDLADSLLPAYSASVTYGREMLVNSILTPCGLAEDEDEVLGVSAVVSQLVILGVLLDNPKRDLKRLRRAVVEYWRINSDQLARYGIFP